MRPINLQQANINSASTCFFKCGPPLKTLHKFLDELKETVFGHGGHHTFKDVIR